MPPTSAEPALTQHHCGSLALPGAEGLPQGVSKGEGWEGLWSRETLEEGAPGCEGRASKKMLPPT